MSNEVNVHELAYGTLDSGIEVEIYAWYIGNYDTHRKRARFFSVSPDPKLPGRPGSFVWFAPSVVELEITRVWNTVWISYENEFTFQRNVKILKVGGGTSAYHLIEAETDN